MNARRHDELEERGAADFSWVFWILALIGAFAVARFAIGLVWTMLPLLVVAGVVFFAYRAISNKLDSSRRSNAALDTSTRRASFNTRTKAPQATSDTSDDALEKLKARVAATEGKKRKKQAPEDDYDARMRELDELERELDLVLDEDDPLR